MHTQSVFQFCFILICFILLVEMCSCEDQRITEDTINMSLLSNPTRVRRFMDCFKNDITCNNEEQKMKQDLVWAIATNCANCKKDDKAKFRAVASVVSRRSSDDPEFVNLIIKALSVEPK